VIKFYNAWHGSGGNRNFLVTFAYEFLVSIPMAWYWTV